MEEHRLKPMVKHDPKIFNELYERTELLKRKLASQIDHRRFGVDNSEIISWFDVKFIFIFNKYYSRFNKDVLLGHLINGLKLFKCRILRSAYTFKYTQSIVSFEPYHYENDTSLSYQSLNYTSESFDYESYQKARDFMQGTLSREAYYLFLLELNPPPFIIKEMEAMGLNNRKKIPADILVKYFELGNSDDSYKYINNLRKEIKDGVSKARINFSKS